MIVVHILHLGTSHAPLAYADHQQPHSCTVTSRNQTIWWRNSMNRLFMMNRSQSKS